MQCVKLTAATMAVLRARLHQRAGSVATNLWEDSKDLYFPSLFCCARTIAWRGKLPYLDLGKGGLVRSVLDMVESAGSSARQVSYSAFEQLLEVLRLLALQLAVLLGRAAHAGIQLLCQDCRRPRLILHNTMIAFPESHAC